MDQRPDLVPRKPLPVKDRDHEHQLKRLVVLLLVQDQVTNLKTKLGGDLHDAQVRHRDDHRFENVLIMTMELTIRLERDDDIPAFGAFLQLIPPDPSKNHVILLNVSTVMSPKLEDENGDPEPTTREERVRLIISTLVHEFGHALEEHFKIPHNEEAIEKAVEDWEKAWNKAYDRAGSCSA